MKCKNCNKEIYVYRSHVYRSGIRKSGREYSIYHHHNNNMRCDDGTYNSVEIEGKCKNCDSSVVLSNSGTIHKHSIFARLFGKCKEPELSELEITPTPRLRF